MDTNDTLISRSSVNDRVVVRTASIFHNAKNTRVELNLAHTNADSVDFLTNLHCDKT